MKIATIINFCTFDMRFLQRCVEAVRPFSDEVYISACDHLFDGTPEDETLLRAASQAAKLVVFPFDPLPPYGAEMPFQPGDAEWPHYLHSVGRYIGAQVARDADFLLFLDVDEIVDTPRFQELLPHFLTCSAVRFQSYFYFRSARFRAKTFQQNALLLKRTALPCLESLLTPLERLGAFQAAEGRTWEGALGSDELPLVHHYSWVRSDEELRRKVRCWGHREERDWISPLEKELSHPFRGHEELFHLSFEESEPFWDPLAETYQRVGIDELKRWELERLLEQP